MKRLIRFSPLIAIGALVLSSCTTASKEPEANASTVQSQNVIERTPVNTSTRVMRQGASGGY
jgi:PBP1b-binding outer membrane lipoprotein LpoB